MAHMEYLGQLRLVHGGSELRHDCHELAVLDCATCVLRERGVWGTWGVQTGKRGKRAGGRARRDAHAGRTRDGEAKQQPQNGRLPGGSWQPHGVSRVEDGLDGPQCLGHEREAKDDAVKRRHRLALVGLNGLDELNDAARLRRSRAWQREGMASTGPESARPGASRTTQNGIGIRYGPPAGEPRQGSQVARSSREPRPGRRAPQPLSPRKGAQPSSRLPSEARARLTAPQSSPRWRCGTPRSRRRPWRVFFRRAGDGGESRPCQRCKCPCGLVALPRERAADLRLEAAHTRPLGARSRLDRGRRAGPGCRQQPPGAANGNRPG